MNNPTAVAASPARVARTSDRPAQPTLVAVLAVLHMIGGAWLLGITLYRHVQIASAGAVLSLPPHAVLLSVVFLGILALASGVGMWRGAPWGWWLATFYYCYAIARNVNALQAIAAMATELANPRQAELYYIKHGIRIGISGLVLVYFFRESVLSYFRMEMASKWLAIGKLAAVTIALMLAVAAATMVL
jgi:hypothetical protein